VRSLSEILGRIEKGEAVVMTSQQVCDLVGLGDAPRLKEVDVVTAATRAVMSGTYAILSFPVASPRAFFRAKRVWINGVEASVGPCPNENLGMVDVMVFGTAHSRDRSDYGGGHLFRDLAERKQVEVVVETDGGCKLETQLGLDEMPYARLFGTRQAFMNYSAFVNPTSQPVSTIFHARGFDTRCSGATFSGCGQINPLKNDPLLETIGVGTRVLYNGAEGFVAGTGTRSSADRPNLAGFADLHEMNPELMGGFVTSAGPECICSWAIPIPITSREILQEIARLDRELDLPIMDVTRRLLLGHADYGQVWQDSDLEVTFDPRECRGCSRCQVEPICPMRAVCFDGNAASRDESRCFHCGLCVTACVSGAFKCNLGTIRLGRMRIPVVLRQSDRLRAQQMAEDLKERIENCSFRINAPVEKIS
jgi:putative methanogenesis marker 16 metalloprotein